MALRRRCWNSLRTCRWRSRSRRWWRALFNEVMSYSRARDGDVLSADSAAIWSVTRFAELRCIKAKATCVICRTSTAVTTATCRMRSWMEMDWLIAAAIDTLARARDRSAGWDAGRSVAPSAVQPVVKGVLAADFNAELGEGSPRCRSSWKRAIRR